MGVPEGLWGLLRLLRLWLGISLQILYTYSASGFRADAVLAYHVISLDYHNDVWLKLLSAESS